MFFLYRILFGLFRDNHLCASLTEDSQPPVFTVIAFLDLATLITHVRFYYAHFPVASLIILRTSAKTALRRVASNLPKVRSSPTKPDNRANKNTDSSNTQTNCVSPPSKLGKKRQCFPDWSHLTMLLNKRPYLRCFSEVGFLTTNPEKPMHGILKEFVDINVSKSFRAFF